MIYKKKIRNDKNAVTSVIIALLLFGLIMTSLVMIQTIYVPRWVEQDEGVHMHEIADSFAQLKYAIDIQTLSQDRIPISTPITLGVEVHSFLSSIRTYGSVNIVKDDVLITISNDSEQISYNLGSIKYNSTNNYYTNQEYILQAGGIIIYQSAGNIFLSEPSRILNDGNFEITFNFINISDLGGKTTISGYGTYSIQTYYSSVSSQNITDVNSIAVSTRYPNAWKLFLNNTLQDIGLEYTTDYTIDINSNSIDVTITDATIVDISIDEVKIIAQISPGRIK